MQIDLENIGIVKKASVKLDGLTVIAGENDTGKSTVGKILYSFIRSVSKDGKLSHLNLNNNLKAYFDNQIADNGNISFKNNEKELSVNIKNNNCQINDYDGEICFYVVEYANPNAIMKKLL